MIALHAIKKHVRIIMTVVGDYALTSKVLEFRVA